MDESQSTSQGCEPFRLLVVDDDSDVRSLLRRLIGRQRALELAGEAADGREAIELAATLAPDLILLDVQMPVLDGIKALPGLRVAAPSARIMMHSAREDLRCEALAVGAHGWVSKGTAWPQIAAHLLELRGRPVVS